LKHLNSILFYASILHFLITELTILPFFVKNTVSVYSPSALSIILFFSYLLTLNDPASRIRHARVKSIFIVPIFFFITAATMDLAASGQYRVNYSIYLIKCILFCLICFVQIARGDNTKKALGTPYHHFCLFILATSTLLLVVRVFDLDSTHSFDTSFLKKDVEKKGEAAYFYSFPFGLGLILEGEWPIKIFGLKFHRYCSYFLEPAIFAFSWIPAIIAFSKTGARFTRAIILSICSVILIWTASLTAFFALAFVVLLSFSKRILKLPIQYLLISSIAVFLLIYFESSIRNASDSISIINKLSSGTATTTQNSLTKQFSQLSSLEGPFNARPASLEDSSSSIISRSFWGIYLISLIFIASKGFLFSNNTETQLISLGSIFIIFMSLKGPQHFIPNPLHLYLLFLHIQSLSPAQFKRMSNWESHSNRTTKT